MPTARTVVPSISGAVYAEETLPLTSGPFRLTVWPRKDRAPSGSGIVIAVLFSYGSFTMRRFFDRYSAGRTLARDVHRLIGTRKEVIILALPRGGVPVGFAVAVELQAPFDILTVRKLGVPGYEELAFGAIAPNGIRVIDEETVREFRLSDDVIKVIEMQERHELRRREKLYRDDLPRVEVRGKTVVLVDDGLATGATMRAAAAWAKKEEAAHIIVAVPVASAEACRYFTQDPSCEICICKRIPEPFHAVGSWYDNFPQLSDAMVTGILQRARGELSGPFEIRRSSVG